MGNNRDLKKEWLRGGKTSFPIPMAASVSIYPQSGKFVSDSTGAILATDASTYLLGWVEVDPWDYTNGVAHPHFLSSGTARATIVNCIRDLTAVFRMPTAYLTATYTVDFAASLIGHCRDIYVSTYQYADLTNGTDDFLIVVGGLASTATVAAGSVGDGYTDVMMNPVTAFAAA